MRSSGRRDNASALTCCFPDQYSRRNCPIDPQVERSHQYPSTSNGMQATPASAGESGPTWYRPLPQVYEQNGQSDVVQAPPQDCTPTSSEREFLVQYQEEVNAHHSRGNVHDGQPYPGLGQGAALPQGPASNAHSRQGAAPHQGAASNTHFGPGAGPYQGFTPNAHSPAPQKPRSLFLTS